MSINGHNTVSAAYFQSAVDCPREVLELTAGPTGSGCTPAQSETGTVNRTDSRERAALIRAFTSADDGLTAAQIGLGSAGAAVARSHHAAETAVEAVERFTAAESPAAKRSEVDLVARRHAHDGPEDLRRRPWIWQALFWPVLFVSTAFDTVYVSKILQSFPQLGPRDGRILVDLTYVPGIGVSICLLAAGTLLGESLFRLRTQAARRSERQRRGTLEALRNAMWSKQPKSDQPTESRQEEGLPWPNLFGPALFTVAILAMICWWASIRASQAVVDSGDVTLVQYEPGVVLLLLILSVAVVMIKVLAHNPYADSDRKSRRALKADGKKAGHLLDEARMELAQHVDTWSRLRATTEAAQGTAQRTLDIACAVIVEERARTGTAGSFCFPLRSYVWPPEKGAEEGSEDGRSREGQSDDSSTETDPRQPRVRFELLDDARSTLARYAPETLDKRLATVAQRLNNQWKLPQRVIEPPPVTEEPDAADTHDDEDGPSA